MKTFKFFSAAALLFAVVSSSQAYAIEVGRLDRISQTGETVQECAQKLLLSTLSARGISSPWQYTDLKRDLNNHRRWYFTLIAPNQNKFDGVITMEVDSDSETIFDKKTGEIKTSSKASCELLGGFYNNEATIRIIDRMSGITVDAAYVPEDKQ